MRIAGVDIGNSTTEVCIGEVSSDGTLRFLGGASRPTTGTKGTVANVHGIKAALLAAASGAGIGMETIALIRLNEAAPVIGDTAMETITETVITESSMIGHNPGTPAGAGQAVGTLLRLENISSARPGVPYLVVIPAGYVYDVAASQINSYADRLQIVGLLLQADEAVLVENRLTKKIPIIDEVRGIDRVPEGKPAAIEVALPGASVRMLSNPYGIATLLGLTAQETRAVTPIAKSLVGKRSAVVIETPGGNVQENALPAGSITIHPAESAKRPSRVEIDSGAEEIMRQLAAVGSVEDITGAPNTNVGSMLQRIRQGMAKVNDAQGGVSAENVRITDILAVDTLAPVAISGALAGEYCMEKAVGIAAMVKTQQLPMRQIAARLEEELHTHTKVAGVEAIMASIGAMTTPGTQLPIAVLDMGGGSTDAALVAADGTVEMTHRAGAGELVTLLIQTELGLSSRVVAEQIKKYPLARVESLYHLRLENGAMQFFDASIDPKYFGRVILLAGEEWIRLEEDIPMEKIVQVRREAKRKVFVPNALRALRYVAPGHNLNKIPNVVLVGGSAEDFEIPEILMEELSDYRIVCGRGNIRATEGPRNAVATGLVLSYLGEKEAGI